MTHLSHHRNGRRLVPYCQPYQLHTYILATYSAQCSSGMQHLLLQLQWHPDREHERCISLRAADLLHILQTTGPSWLLAPGFCLLLLGSKVVVLPSSLGLLGLSSIELAAAAAGLYLLHSGWQSLI